MGSLKPFGWYGMTRTCQWCGEEIETEYGFCSNRCGRQFAEMIVSTGAYISDDKCAVTGSVEYDLTISSRRVNIVCVAKGSKNVVRAKIFLVKK